MTVTNPYYEFTPTFTPGTTVRAAEVNTQYQALQTAFDFLPGANDALTTGTATFAPETGSSNAFVVTMPDTRTVNQDGDQIIFYASHANAGAATLNVDSIGAVTLTDRTGAALVANDIVSGRLYVATYDASNTRFVLDVTTNVVTNILSTVQGTATGDPATGAIQNAILNFVNATSQIAGFAGYTSQDILIFQNRVHGGNVQIRAEDAGGSNVLLFEADPDGVGQMYNIGAPVVQTATAAAGGLKANNALTGGGFERVLTIGDDVITATTAQLADITDSINTDNAKRQGYRVFNSTTNIPVWAVGATDGAVWVDATGATAHTPV